MTWGGAANGRRRTMVLLILLIAACADVVHGQTAAAVSAALRARATDDTYNLDHGEALQLLRQAVAADPGNPLNHRQLAAALWLDILFQRGEVTVDHFLGGFTSASVDLHNPPADLDAEFKREAARAVELCERRVAAAPGDPQTHFDLGTAVGLQASYIASVEGRLLAGFRAARRSYDEEEEVLTLAPGRTDAGLIVGTYRYLVSTLSLPMRMMAYVAGFGGGKERGIAMIERAAQAHGDNATDAKFALVLLYNREHRYQDALRVLQELRLAYPRNRLVLLEQGATASRAGRAAEADAVLTDGIAIFEHDARPKIPGERALWHYKRGAARVQLDHRDAATADLRVALEPGALPWVRGRAHVEFAKLAARGDDRGAVARETANAIEDCTNGHDPLCVEEARKVQHGG